MPRCGSSSNPPNLDHSASAASARISCPAPASSSYSSRSNAAALRASLLSTCSNDLSKRAIGLVELDAAQRARERDALLDDAIGDGDDDVRWLSVGILQLERERHVEDVAGYLLDVHDELG